MRTRIVKRAKLNPVFGQITVYYRRGIGREHFAHHRHIVKEFFDLSCVELVLEREIVRIFFRRRRKLSYEKQSEHNKPDDNENERKHI